MERTIPLPNNRAVELGSKFPAENLAQILHLSLLNQSYAPVRMFIASGAISTSSAYEVATNAVRHAQDNSSSIKRKGYSVKAEDRVHEPTHAIVDGICCLEYTINAPGGSPSDNEPAPIKSSKPPHWFTSFMNLFSNVKQHQTCTTGRTKSFDAEFPGTNGMQKVEYNDSHAKCFLCTNVTERLPTFRPSWQAVRGDSVRIYVPFIAAEYKRDPAMTRQSFHQVQMYCVSCVEYLATIGITDFPVWGIATSSTVGIIIMAWKSTKSSGLASQPEVLVPFSWLAHTNISNRVVDDLTS